MFFHSLPYTSILSFFPSFLLSSLISSTCIHRADEVTAAAFKCFFKMSVCRQTGDRHLALQPSALTTSDLWPPLYDQRWVTSSYGHSDFLIYLPCSSSLLLPLRCSVNLQKPADAPSSDHSRSKGQIYPNHIKSAQASIPKVHPRSPSQTIVTTKSE